jgi:CheY-like chemotaxis protein
VHADAGGGFTGIRIEGIDGEVRLSDGPATPEAISGLPRPWRRDALIRAVARAAGRAPVIAAMPAVRPTAPLNGRVLVVDDNSVNRKILARQLELAGASTDAAAGGEEALDLWRTGNYDLVLADLQMPSMDGFELARRIRENERVERRERTPILAVTASALEDQEQKSRAVGMDGLITKPVGIEQLRATLDVWLKDARVEHTT